MQTQTTPPHEPPPLKPAVAIGLDGVLARYDGWQGIRHIGDPLPGALEFVRRLCERYTVIVHTTRCATGLNYCEVPLERRSSFDGAGDYLVALVRAWLARHGFPAELHVWAMPGKPLAIAYIDDRAVCCRPQEAGERAYELAMLQLDSGPCEWGPAQAAAAGACHPLLA